MSSPINENETEKCPDVQVYNTTDIKRNFKGDRMNFILLLLLYTMQGFPIGLTSAIPILLQSMKDVSYQDQALFSLVIWPFSLKLLWAPLVDALYVRKIGRRKSWLLPVQYLLGSCLLYMSNDIDTLFPKTDKPNIMTWTYMFFITNILAATQDIVIDGWALTILNKKNLDHTSTCNTTGQTIGVMLGSMVPILLTSEDFCNKYLWVEPETGGVVSIESFFFVWGIIFMSATTLIAIFKKEKDHLLEENQIKLNVAQNYGLIWDILKLPGIRKLTLALLTARVGFSVTDSVTYLKLIDAGISKDDIAIINTALCLIKICLPLLSAKYTSGPKPMSIYLKSTIMKLTWSIAFLALIYITPRFVINNGFVDIPVTYYVVLIFVLFVDEIVSYIMFVAMLSFFSRICDPRFGGTYLTLLNTVSNLGFTWTSTVALGMIDLLTIKVCSKNSKNYCSTMDQQNTCETIGGDCDTLVNGYYIGTFICMIVGLLWICVFKNVLKSLQTKSSCYWLVKI